MACKSSVSVNDLHVQFFYIYTYPVAVYMYFLTITQPHVNVGLLWGERRPKKGGLNVGKY
jgi:hypothetical protein